MQIGLEYRCYEINIMLRFIRYLLFRHVCDSLDLAWKLIWRCWKLHNKYQELHHRSLHEWMERKLNISASITQWPWNSKCAFSVFVHVVGDIMEWSLVQMKRGCPAPDKHWIYPDKVMFDGFIVDDVNSGVNKHD